MKAPVVGFSARSEKTQRARPHSGAGRTGFAALLGDGPATTAGPAACAAPAAIASLLALQDMAGAPSPREVQQRAETLLQRLDRLHADLLDGRIDAGQLQQMADALRQPRPESGDRRLDDIVDAIELRVEVELAKWSGEGCRRQRN
jgi:hypothetical protein